LADEVDAVTCKVLERGEFERLVLDFGGLQKLENFLNQCLQLA